MKIHNEYATLHARQPREFINITAQVKAAVAKSEIQEGIVLVSSLHVNTGIFVNDEEPGLLADIDECFERLAPHRDGYQHGAKFESNASAHLKSLLLHHQVALAVTGGKIEIGPWQNVIFAEFDGGRPKRVLIKVLGM